MTHVDHGWRHAPKAEGGTDPIPGAAAAAAVPGLVVSGDYSLDTEYGFDRDGAPLFNFSHADLRNPFGYAFDKWNNIYVVNGSLSTTRAPVFKFNSVGTFIKTFGTVGAGSANGQCDEPCGICLDAAGNMYIVDTGNDRIQKWDEFGAYVAKWGTTGSGNSQFNYGTGGFGFIAYDGTYLYVTDEGNDRIQKFSTAGTYQTQWGSSGSGDSQFSRPCGIAVAPDGTIYVVDQREGGGAPTTSRIQHFSNTGTFIDKYTSPTAAGSADGEFNRPNDCDVDDEGNIYVADDYNFRVQKFSSAYVWLASFDMPAGGAIAGVAVRPNAVAL